MSVDKEFVVWFKENHPSDSYRYWMKGHNYPTACIKDDFAAWWEIMDGATIQELIQGMATMEGMRHVF